MPVLIPGFNTQRGAQVDIGDAAECRLRREATLRRERIDKLGVDRTMFDNCPLQRWSPEAECREPAFEDLRANATMQDKCDAWRELFQLTVKDCHGR